MVLFSRAEVNLQYLSTHYVKDTFSKAAHLSQVQFEYVADVVGIKVREFHQVLAILKRLAQLLHPRLGTIHTVDALQCTKTNAFNTGKLDAIFWLTMVMLSDHNCRISAGSYIIQMYLQKACPNFK